MEATNFRNSKIIGIQKLSTNEMPLFSVIQTTTASEAFPCLATSKLFISLTIFSTFELFGVDGVLGGDEGLEDVLDDKVWDGGITLHAAATRAGLSTFKQIWTIVSFIL